MDDRNLMEGLLLQVKGVCDLYMHGSMESSTHNVHCTFENALNESLCMQNEIYNKMAQKGWYAVDQAEAQKVGQVKQKFAPS